MMSPAKPPRGRLLVVGCLLLVAVSGCTRAPRRTKEQLFERGKAFDAQKKYAEASIEYRGAVQLDPRFGAARYALSQDYLKTNQPARAAGELVRAADLMPDNVAVNLEAGQMLLLGGKFEDARTRAMKVLALDPTNVQAQLLKGSAAAGLKDMTAAFADVEEAVKIDPKNTRSQVMLGTLQASRGRITEAEATFVHAVELAPNSVDAQMALANFYYANGRTPEAEGPLKRAIAIEPRNVTAQRTLAMYYVGTGRDPEAEAPLKAIVEIQKNPGARLALADYYVRVQREPEALILLKEAATRENGVGPATIRLAMLDYDKKRTADAYRQIDAVLAKAPRNADALTAKGRFLMADRKVGEALVLARAATAADPESVVAWNLLGSIYLARNEVDDAVAALSQVVKLNPRAQGARLQLAQLQLRKGSAQTALQLAEDVTRQAPRDVTARVMLASTLEAAGNRDRAKAIVTDLLKEHPSAAPLHAQLARLLLGAKDRAGARREFDRALELDPNSLEALGGLVAVDLGDKNETAARAAVEKRLQQSPRQPDVLLLAANTYAALRDSGKQEATLRRLLDVDSESLPGITGLAALYAQQGKLDQARTEYEAISKRQPKSVTAPTMVAMILEAQHKPAEAQKAYEAILATTPTAALAANNLAWMYAEGGGNLDLALHYAQSARERLPNQPRINDTLGWIYYKRDLASLAIPAFQTSVHADPNNPLYRYHLGLAYARTRDVPNALEAFDAALRLKPDFRDAADARKALAGK